MPTTGVPSSSLVKLRFGATPVAMARLTGGSIKIGSETRDITSKDTAGWRDVLPGLKTASLSLEGLVDYGAAAGANHALLLTAQLNNTLVDFEYGTGVAGDPRYKGKAIVTSWDSQTPGTEENCTFSAELQVAGAVTVDAYP